MKYIHNLQKTCVVKVKATGIPHYSALKKNNILIIEFMFSFCNNVQVISF